MDPSKLIKKQMKKLPKRGAEIEAHPAALNN